jgi:siroheme synthase
MTWNSVESVVFKNVAATQGPFTLRGGSYGVTVSSASFSGGSVTLQRLADDGATYVTVLTAFAAAGYASVNLPAGTYQLAIATATAVYADITSIVTTM